MQVMQYKKCPFCKFWVEKTVGCNHMTCRCGKMFCYKCGGNYTNCKCNGFYDSELEVDQLRDARFAREGKRLEEEEEEEEEEKPYIYKSVPMTCTFYQIYKKTLKNANSKRKFIGKFKKNK